MVVLCIAVTKLGGRGGGGDNILKADKRKLNKAFI